MNEGDKNTCREIAREIVKEVLSEHTRQCPHAIKLKYVVTAIIFTCIGSTVGTGGVYWFIVKEILAKVAMP